MRMRIAVLAGVVAGCLSVLADPALAQQDPVGTLTASVRSEDDTSIRLQFDTTAECPDYAWDSNLNAYDGFTEGSTRWRTLSKDAAGYTVTMELRCATEDRSSVSVGFLSASYDVLPIGGATPDPTPAPDSAVLARLDAVEAALADLSALVSGLETRVAALEAGSPPGPTPPQSGSVVVDQTLGPGEVSRDLWFTIDHSGTRYACETDGEWHEVVADSTGAWQTTATTAPDSVATSGCWVDWSFDACENPGEYLLDVNPGFGTATCAGEVIRGVSFATLRLANPPEALFTMDAATATFEITVPVAADSVQLWNATGGFRCGYCGSPWLSVSAGTVLTGPVPPGTDGHTYEARYFIGTDETLIGTIVYGVP